jgi:hypothetical protein
LVDIDVDIVGVVPPEEVIGPVAPTDVTADVKYVFVSKANVPAAVIFTKGVPETQVG